MNNNIDIDNIIYDTNIRIKEKIENINIDVARNIPNGVIGVYIFWLKSGDAYIGMSEGWGGIRSRIHSHTREGWQRKIIERFNIYRTETIFHAFELESMMIRKLKPELNSGCCLDMQKSVFINRPKELENRYRLGNVIITYILIKKLTRKETIDIGNFDIRVVDSNIIELVSDNKHIIEDCEIVGRELGKRYGILTKKCEKLTKTYIWKQFEKVTRSGTNDCKLWK